MFGDFPVSPSQYGDAAYMDGQLSAMVDPGEWLGVVLERELILGCVLHSARIVVYKLTSSGAYVWVRFEDDAGVMRVGRVSRVRVRGGAPQPTGMSASAALGSWWLRQLEGFAKRGKLADGYRERVDLLFPSLPVYSAEPLVQVRRDYLRAKAIGAGAVSIAQSANFTGEWAAAAARYAGKAAALLADAESQYIAAGGSV